jgi:hypothetical protein
MTTRIDIEEARATIRKLRSALRPGFSKSDLARLDDHDCTKCGESVAVDDGCVFDRGDWCHKCAQEFLSIARAALDTSKEPAP